MSPLPISLQSPSPPSPSATIERRPFPSTVRPRVAHVVLSLDVGGLERVVVDLVRAGSGAATIICLERPGQLAAQAEALGAAVVSLGKPAGLRPRLVGKMAELMRRFRPDVVHTHQIGALLYAGPAARRAGVPVVVHTEHGKHYASRWRTRVLGRWAAGYADRFFCVSADIRREVIRHRIVAASKAVVAPNGVDVARFAARDGRAALRAELGFSPDAFVVGTVGRLAEVKRQDVLLDAFARLSTQHPNARLLLVGDGPLRGDLEARSATLGVSGLVTFAGYQDRPDRFYAVMDAFALTSRSEGMPLSVLEAWAAGLPVVVSRVGGLPELVTEGQTGLLFPAGDVAACAAALGRVASAGVAAALGAAGQDVVRHRFDVRVMADAYQQSYRELLTLPRS